MRWLSRAGRPRPSCLRLPAAVLIVLGPVAALHADPAVRVTASYPGASAPVAYETVAAPIEQQLRGMDGLARLWTECRHDGSVTLTAYLKPRSDVHIAQVLVQNRVSLAQPLLPDAVNLRGIEVTWEGPGRRPVLWLTLVARKGDAVDLMPTADTVCDELRRMAGVGDVRPVGVVTRTVRVRLDPDRLDEYGVTAGDVAQALEAPPRKAPEPPAAPGKEFQYTLTVPGRPDPETLAGVVVKTLPGGRTVRLKDVARVEAAERAAVRVWVKGRPAVALEVRCQPAAVGRVRDALADLRRGLPERAALDVAADLTAADLVRVELFAPDGASAERLRCLADTAAEAVAGVDGVEVLLAEAGPDRARLLVRVEGKGERRDERLRALRARLGRLANASFRLGDPLADALPPPRRFPVTLTVQADGHKETEGAAGRLREVLAKSTALADVRLEGGSVRRFGLLVDRDRAAALGVKMADVDAVLRVALGEVAAPDGAWTLSVALADETKTWKRLKVVSTDGHLVPLASLAELRFTEGPTTVTALDGKPSVLLTADLLPGTSAAEARRAVRQAVAAAGLHHGVRVLLWGRDLDEPEDVTPRR